MYRKILLVSFCFALALNGNAQQKKAAPRPNTSVAGSNTGSKEKKPTKQETMDWIGNKMKDNLGGGRVFISYSNGKFVYNRSIGGYNCINTLDLNSVTGMSNEYSDDFYVTGKNFNLSVCDDEAKTTSNYQQLSISGPNYNNYGAPFNFTPDQALVDRLKKAFQALIEHNSSKKAEGEAF